MKRIYYQFSTTKGIDSWFIRWFTWSKYSHVDLVMEDGKLLGARLTSDQSFTGRSGVQIRPPNYENFSNTLCVYLEVSDSQYDQFWKIALGEAEKKYDWGAILGFVFKKDWRCIDRWFCSEYALWVATQAGIKLLNLDPINRCSPGLLLCSPLFIYASHTGRLLYRHA